jgi:hypothetical protein
MNINPELQRQFYLECTPTRLLGIPALLCLVFTFCYYLDDYQLGSSTAHSAFILYLLISLVWGLRQSMDSILEEFREQTWDIQRLSAIQPWQLCWGKWLGSTLIVWYAGLPCLVIYSLATYPSEHLGQLWFYCIVTGVWVQALGLLLGQLMAQSGKTKAASSTLIVLFGCLYMAAKVSDISSVAEADSALFNDQQAQLWYHYAFAKQWFNQASLVFALFWTAVGNYRLMAKELGIRSLPWVWLAFNLSLVIYVAGFFAFEYAFTVVAFILCTLLTYIGIITEPSLDSRSQNLLRFIQLRAWRRFGEELPLWCISFLLTAPFALQLSFSNHPFSALTSWFHFYPLALWLLLLRDCSVYVFFSLAKHPQYSLSRSLLIAVLLNAVIPGILSLSGLEALSALFFPLWADSETAALCLAGLQICLLAYLLFQRINLGIQGMGLSNNSRVQ